MTETTKKWPERPYKGLAYYDRDDAPLLAGRERDVLQCARRLRDSRTVLLTLHGETACGKSSFLRPASCLSSKPTRNATRSSQTGRSAAG